MKILKTANFKTKTQFFDLTDGDTLNLVGLVIFPQPIIKYSRINREIYDELNGHHPIISTKTLPPLNLSDPFNYIRYFVKRKNTNEYKEIRKMD